MRDSQVMRDTWSYDDLPNVKLTMSGRLSVKRNADFRDDTIRSHYDHLFNWRINEEDDEFVVRISRKAIAPSHGHINVDVKIEGGITTQPDGSVRFDGGTGNGEGNNVSKFSLSFEISHESPPDSVPQEEWKRPEEHEIKFFDHPEHKLFLAPENYYNDVNMGKATCDACTKPIRKGNARWVYECSGDCDYGVHAKCAQLARTIRHPSHPKHNLQLLKLAPGDSRICDVCRRVLLCGLHYNCVMCDFDLHPECPDPEKDNSDEAEAEAQKEMTPAQLQLQLQMTQQMAASMASAGQAICSLIG